jgi:hypothetical protein
VAMALRPVLLRVPQTLCRVTHKCSHVTRAQRESTEFRLPPAGPVAGSGAQVALSARVQPCRRTHQGQTRGLSRRRGIRSPLLLCGARATQTTQRTRRRRRPALQDEQKGLGLFDWEAYNQGWQVRSQGLALLALATRSQAPAAAAAAAVKTNRPSGATRALRRSRGPAQRRRSPWRAGQPPS